MQLSLLIALDYLPLEYKYGQKQQG